MSDPTARERFRRNYVVPFLQYYAQRSETALRAAYELGRAAMRDRLSLLDLAQIHHGVFLDTARSLRHGEELEDLAESASAFLTEVLVTFEMAQRAFAEAQQGGPELKPLEQAHKDRSV